MRTPRETLFCKQDIHSVLEHQKQKVVRFIEERDPDYLLNVSEQDFIIHVTGSFELAVPTLREDDRHAEEPVEMKVDVSGDIRYGYVGHGPVMANGMMTTIVVPFEGDPNFFHIQPTTRTYGTFSSPVLEARELRFEFVQIKSDPEEIKRNFEQGIKAVRDNLKSLRESIAQYHSELPVLIQTQVAKRKKRLLESRGMVEALGIPVKRRDGAPPVVRVPVERKKLIVEPKVASGEFKPEYALDEGVYQEILGLMANMAQVMEFSPGAFVGMKEEDLRSHFLVQLNAQFQGQATGETFNYEGKTDIRLGVQGRSAFIGECKFWKGEKGFMETIDQLLSYLSWRNTKSALVIFNRNVNFTEVLQTIVKVVPHHPHFKRDLGKQGDSTFRYIFGHPEDTNRELTVTVMIFNVPVKA